MFFIAQITGLFRPAKPYPRKKSTPPGYSIITPLSEVCIASLRWH